MNTIARARTASRNGAVTAALPHQVTPSLDVAAAGVGRAVLRTPETLRALLAVADHGSVCGAAAVLHLTPGAVSDQLSRLERQVGRRLVDRDRRGCPLTAHGRPFARAAEAALQMLDGIETLLDVAATTGPDLPTPGVSGALWCRPASEG